VEDDPGLRRMLCETLTAQRYLVLEAAEGTEALTLIERHSVDLIITDRAMPGMDGLQLLKKLKALQIEIPVLMISAYGEEELWGEAIGLGAKDYLVKPFKAEDVLKFVKKALAGNKK